MKFAVVLAIFAAFVAVGAAPVETNAQRMARGLPPLYPPSMKRASPVEGTRYLPSTFSTQLTFCDLQPPNAPNLPSTGNSEKLAPLFHHSYHRLPEIAIRFVQLEVR
jgi:hypothetical protein